MSYFSKFLIRLLILSLSFPLQAQESYIGWQPNETDNVCVKDIDGDGNADDAGEALLCNKGSTYDSFQAYKFGEASGYSLVDVPSCPIDQVSCVKEDIYYCPFDDSVCSTNSCTQETACVQTSTGYDCPLTPGNDNFASQNACSSACKQTTACVKQKTFSCPYGDEFACVNLDSSNATDNFMCSSSVCGTYGDNSTTNTINRDILADDADYDVEGNCLGNVAIFSGRAMDCRLAGVASAGKNCCADNDGEVYNDNMGGLTETAIYTETLALTYGAASAAYTAYSAGSTAAEAGTAATEYLAGAVDPTTLVVVVVIAIIMAYLENACPPEDIETAILEASGYCITLGTACTTEWFGSCVQEVEVKCCYNSMMSRIINEQGRPQLGLGFGTVDNPSCQGFTQEQFQALDFSKIDMSEYYDEIRKASQETVEQVMQETINNATGN